MLKNAYRLRNAKKPRTNPAPSRKGFYRTDYSFAKYEKQDRKAEGLVLG